MVINCYIQFIHDLLTINILYKRTIFFKLRLYLIILNKMYINNSHVY